MTTEKSENWFQRQRDRLLAGGAVMTATALAGCIGGDSDGTENDEPDDTENFPNLMSAFGDVTFQDGQMIVEIESDIELSEVVLIDPYGQQVESVTPSQAEQSVGFGLYDGSSGRNFTTYAQGTYHVRGYQPSDETDITDTETRDGDTLVASNDYHIEPDPELVDISDSNEEGAADFVIENTGTGPLPIQYFHLQGGVLISLSGRYPEMTILPGERDAVTVDVEDCDESPSDHTFQLRWNERTLYHFEASYCP